MSLYNPYGVSTQKCFPSLSVVLVDLGEDGSPQALFPKGTCFQGGAESCRWVLNVTCPVLLFLSFRSKNSPRSNTHWPGGTQAQHVHHVIDCAGIWRSYVANLNCECHCCWALSLYQPKARTTTCGVFEQIFMLMCCEGTLRQPKTTHDIYPIHLIQQLLFFWLYTL